MTKKFPSVLFPILLILVVPLLAFWQATLGVYAMKWDIMDQFFPCRYFISECFKNGIIPYWCPYIHLGYPLYADPQAGWWYPVSFLLAVTAGYNIYTIQFEFTLHLVVAACGMYLLLRTLGTERIAAAVGGVLFPVSGFFVSHASHLTWIISMAWLPWVFNYYVLGLREQKPFRFVQTGFFLALCLTGGYVVFPVLACYGLLFIFLYHVICLQKEKTITTQIALYSALTPVAFLLLSSGYVLSLAQSLPYLKRAEGLTLEIANINPFSPASFLSWLFPLSACVNTDFFNTDATMRNLYMGVLIFPLLAAGITFGNRTRNFVLFAVGTICLMAAMGAYLPVRSWLYHTLPFMKMFRHTAIFRAFTLIAFLLIAVNGLQVLFENPKPKTKKLFLIVLGLTALLFIVVFGIAAQKENIRLRFPDFLSINSMSAFFREANIYKAIIVQFAFSGIILALSFACILLLKDRKLAWAISLLWLADVTVAAQLNVAGTVVSEIPTTTFHTAFKNLPKGFPKPGSTPVEQFNQYGGETLAPVVYNASILRKQPCADGFNAFCLKDYMQFFTSEEATTVLKQPVVYFSDKDGNATTADPTNTPSVTLTKFSPGNIVVAVETKETSYLTLLQAYFPGWKVAVNKKEAAPVISKGTFMTIEIPEGKSSVTYRYTPSRFHFFASLQLLSYIGFILATAVFYFRKLFNNLQ